MKKQKLLIIILVLVVLSLFIGYYEFKISSNSDKDATKVDDINVIFSEIGIINKVNTADASATISKDKKEITIGVDNLYGKGSYAIFPITIRNEGALSAKLYSIREYGLDKEGPIKVLYSGIGVTDVPIHPGEETTFIVKIYCDEELLNETIKTKIKLKFNYVQE